MNNEIDAILKKIYESLRNEFKSRFKGLVLYGSALHDSMNEQSDIDILVLLGGPVNLGIDLERVVNVTYFIQLTCNNQLHFQLADFNEYSTGSSSFYRTVLKEGKFV